MPLPPALARWLSNQGHDAVHAAELGLDRAPDTAIILRAKQEARAIVTADLDYPHLLAIMQAIDPSLILFRGGDWSQADLIARMKDILVGLHDTDIAHSILVVERNRIRRRRLPIDG
jgi:predicted nuclease of predicted toxin-antitoxin system